MAPTEVTVICDDESFLQELGIKGPITMLQMSCICTFYYSFYICYDGFRSIGDFLHAGVYQERGGDACICALSPDYRLIDDIVPFESAKDWPRLTAR